MCAAEFAGKVISVIDGDTLWVMRVCEKVEPEAPGMHSLPACAENDQIKVRLAEVDAPEKTQPYGIESQQSLAAMVLGKQVQVESRAIDDYGRMVASVLVDEIDVGYEQARRGMAWASRLRDGSGLAELQREARQARRGLWAGEEIIEPSKWRKQHPYTYSGAAPASSAPHPAEAPLKSDCTKKHCAQMVSCEEARDHLTRCGANALDGDGNGIPCEQLCAPQKQIKN